MRAMQDRWLTPEFVAAAHAWIDDRLAGARTHPHRRGRAAPRHRLVDGDARADRRRHGVVQGQRRVDGPRGRGPGAGRRPLGRPGPAPLVRDPATGWMLLADAGPRLRDVIPEEGSLARWHDVLEAYARVQIACEDDVDAAPRPRPPRPPPRHAAGCVRRPAGRARRRRSAVARPRRDPGPLRPARRLRHPRDRAARRPPRRPGLPRLGRPPGARLGRRVRVPPVLHPRGDAGGRHRVGRRRRRGLRGPRAAPRWPTSARTPTTTDPSTTCARPRGSRCGSAGSAGRSTARSRRTPSSTRVRLRMFLDGSPSRPDR